jgi:hypothetical protein
MMNKYPEAASVVQQVYKVLINIEILAGYTPAKMGERSEWISTVNKQRKTQSTFAKL